MAKNFVAFGIDGVDLFGKRPAPQVQQNRAPDAPTLVGSADYRKVFRKEECIQSLASRRLGRDWVDNIHCPGCHDASSGTIRVRESHSIVPDREISLRR